MGAVNARANKGGGGGGGGLIRHIAPLATQKPWLSATKHFRYTECSAIVYHSTYPNVFASISLYNLSAPTPYGHSSRCTHRPARCLPTFAGLVASPLRYDGRSREPRRRWRWRCSRPSCGPRTRQKFLRREPPPGGLWVVGPASERPSERQLVYPIDRR
jgi:hypothetical protein